MNFSANTLRKVLSLTLCVCLTAALLAGCKKDDKTPASTDPGLNLVTDNTTTAPVETQPQATEPTVKINENTGVVLSGMNVRSSPSQDANVTATLSAGDRVEIVRREELSGTSWGYITDPVGWIVLDYVKMDIEQTAPAGPDTSTPAGNGEITPTEPPATTTVKGVITANGLNIRSEPKTGKVQGSYNKGDVVTILETKDGWGRTNKGWISMDYVNTTGTSSNTGSNTGSNTNNNTNTSSNVSGNGSTTVQFRGIVIASDLNIRASASQSADRLGSYSYGKRVEFYEKDGSWGRTKDGWISLNYVYQDGTTGSNTATGTVTGNGLRIRSGPGTGYDVVGSLSAGDTVKILEQFKYDGTTWGCIKNGWISMDYVDIGSGSSGGTDSGTGSGTTNGSQTGTITATGLYIRSTAGKDGAVVGSYQKGDVVTILETTSVGTTQWGRTNLGWISMDYVNLT